MVIRPVPHERVAHRPQERRSLGEHANRHTGLRQPGRIKTGIDGDWHTRQFSYDSLDRVTLATDSLGNTRSFQYDSNDNSTSQRLDINGRLIDSRSSSFDQNDRCTRSVDAAGNVTAMHYDPAGNLIQLVTPDNYATSYEYDPLNRLIRSFDRAIQVVGPQHLDSGLGMILRTAVDSLQRLGKPAMAR